MAKSVITIEDKDNKIDLDINTDYALEMERAYSTPAMILNANVVKFIEVYGKYKDTDIIKGLLETIEKLRVS